MLPTGYCENIMFMNSAKGNTCEQNGKTEGDIGQLIATIPESISCYYKIPVECRRSFCVMYAYLAIENNATVQIKICGIQQG